MKQNSELRLLESVPIWMVLRERWYIKKQNIKTSVEDKENKSDNSW